MFVQKNNLFQCSENEAIFKDLCDKMKKHPFESPWKNYSIHADKEQIPCGVQEISLPELFNDFISSTNNTGNVEKPTIEGATSKNISNPFEEKLLILRDSLVTVQDSSTTDHIKGIEILSTICLSQVQETCDMLQNSLSSEYAVYLFISAILKLETPLSLYIATALVTSIIYPQVFESKENTSRNLIAAILNFSEIYPKAVVDKMILPCLNKTVIETLQLDTLLKIIKNNLSNECVSYCIKSILEQATPTENTFNILQNLIERKINQPQSIHETLSWTIENWSSTCKKNVKFTKLVISILTTYGTELKQQQITTYQDVIEKNETLMKRAAENVLKKLKKNV